MTDLASLSLVRARDGLRQREFSASELLDACLARIARASKLNLFTSLDEDSVRAAARAADSQLASDDAPPLAGLPVGIKDIFCVRGEPSCAASRILEGFVPDYEAEVVSRLRAAGALPAGKLNTDEFAMGSSNETSCYGAAINPWRAKNDTLLRVPGGSSGGPAAAVAAGLLPASLGTDTGGSIRQPAAFTGTVGVKPTYGRCSRYGMIAFASSLDQAGPFARSVADAALLLRYIAGHDPKDSTSAIQPPPEFAKIGRPEKPLKIGIPASFRHEGMSAEIEKLWEQAADWLKAQGAEIVACDLPSMHYALPAYYIIACAEASSNLARYDGVRYGLRVEEDSLDAMYEASRAAGFGAEVKRRLMLGTYALSAGYYDAYYIKAQKVRTLIAREFAAAFARADVLLTPATPASAFALGEKTQDPLAMYLNDIFTVPASLAGLPALVLPAGLDSKGLPLGLQLTAPAFAEENLFHAAHWLEEAAGFQHQPERWWEQE